MAYYKSKIIGGELAKKIISLPKDKDIRPTSDAMKKSIFNVLAHNFYINFQETNIIDVCAGSGAIGIESLSRGSKQGIFIDNNINALNCIIKNIRLLQLEDRSVVIKANALFITHKIVNHFKNDKDIIIFIDPPYSMKDLLFHIVHVFSKITDKKILYVIESDTEFVTNSTVLIKKYSNRVVSFLTQNIH